MQIKVNNNEPAHIISGKQTITQLQVITPHNCNIRNIKNNGTPKQSIVLNNHKNPVIIIIKATIILNHLPFLLAGRTRMLCEYYHRHNNHLLSHTPTRKPFAKCRGLLIYFE